jgi:DNA-binding beta-propeller fold protein YncE
MVNHQQGTTRTGNPPSGRAVAFRAACILIAALGLACAQGRGKLPIRLQWPEPPLKTRIEHVRTISSPRDLGQAPSNWERFVNALLKIKPRVRALSHPVDIEVTPHGRTVYVSDFAQGTVHVFDLVSGEARYIGGDRGLQRPFGLALDSAGNLYVVEQDLRQIRVISPEGQTLRIFQSDRLIRPADIAIDETRGRLYVADPSHQKSTEHYVRVLDLEGNYLGEVGEGRGLGDGHLLFPTYLTLDPEGNLYVSDTMNSRVSVFDPDGRFLRAIGGRGDGFGRFDKPKGVALDSFGNLYVVDSSWSNVQIFGPEAEVLLFFGGRGGYPGLLRNPTGIAIARATNTIFVGDYLNRRIVVYQLVNTGPGDGVARQATQGGKP